MPRKIPPNYAIFKSIEILGQKKRLGIMTAQEFLRTLSGTSPTIPSGLSLPEIIITRRTRTHSMNGRIGEEIHEGIVKFFCRSRGHGFIDDDEVSLKNNH